MSATTQTPVSKSIIRMEDQKSWYGRYSRSIWLFLTAIVGFISILPIFGFLRLALFVIPITCFCWAMTGNENRFNLLLFAFILAIILVFSSMFMTSFISMSALDPPEIDYPAFSMENFNYTFTLDAIDSFLAPIYTFLLIGIPGIAIAGSIWAVIVGRIDIAIKTILKILGVILLMIIVVAAFDAFGYEIPGVSDAVKAAAEFYLGSINTVYDWITDIYCLITGCDGEGPEWDKPTGTPGGIQAPPAGTTTTKEDGTEVTHGDFDEDEDVDWWEEWLYSLFNNQYDAALTKGVGFQICVLSCVPWLASGLNVLFSLIFLSKKARIWTINFFDNVVPEIEEDPELHLLSFNYKMGAFAILILFGAWMLFLNFAGIYQETGIIQFTQIGYISIYTIMVVTAVIFLSLPRVTLYVKSNWKNTTIGTFIGLAILYMMLQFMTGSTKTMSAYEYEYTDPAVLQVLNTFVFVAPAESIFFHILIPAFFLGWMYNRARKNLQRETLTIVEQKLEQINNKIDALEEVREIFPKGTKQRAMIVYRLESLRRRKNKLRRPVVLDKDFVFQDLNVYLLFYIVILGSNLLFSISHWVLSGVDFYIFWLSGLGIIYLVAGCIMTIIGWRYGWFSAILTHAIYNSLSIIMLALLAGGF